MPVKNKRNGQSRKQRTEALPIMYSHSLEDTPSTSAASSPADHPPAFETATAPTAFDPGTDYAREEVAHEGFEGDLLGSQFADPPRSEDEAPLPVPPPSAMREASLPESKVGPESPALNPEPLVDADIAESPEVQERGHVRSPVLAREPSALESFSRTIRGYVPSSIPIPSVAPTPPRVSRPLSFGTLLSPTRSTSSSHSRGADLGETTKRRGSDVSPDQRMRWHEQRPISEENDGAVFSLDEEVATESVQPSFSTRYPSSSNAEDIVWTSWDSIEAGDVTPRRVLLVGYPGGFQIWDCSNLGSISEILNLSGPEWTDVQMAAVLPNPLAASSSDPLSGRRPAVGIIRSPKQGATEFLVYSLRSHVVVKSIKLPSLVSFTASRDFVVLSTTQPPALHVLSSRTFASLYNIPSSSLVTFAHHTSSLTSEAPIVSSLPVDQTLHSSQSVIPRPIFSLSNRLLAYAAPPPKPESPLESPSRLPRTGSQSSDDGTIKFPTTQAELGSAAVKIGGSVLSGMKVLGGMAFTAARAGVSAAATAAERRYSADASATGASGKFFSRSAPADSGRDEHRYTQTTGDIAPDIIEPATAEKQEPVDVAHYITVVDLAPLAVDASQVPARVAEFFVGKNHPISLIQFSHDGTSLMVATRGGHTMKVYQLRPARRGRNATGADGGLLPPWHTYDLRRGRTSAVVESLTWAHDGRWMAVATEKGTVHVFATNPYGGPADEQSHLNGRVMNPKEVQPLSTELQPLIRLRVQRPQGPDAVSVPLACTFLPQSTHLPSSLSSTHSHFQDTLLFDPRDGTLSLRRIVLARQTRERVPSTFGPVSLPGSTSISLPGTGTLSTQTTTGSPRAPSALTKMMARSTELVATEHVVATWVLQRAKDWKVVRRPVRTAQPRRRPSRIAKADWLAQAELSTHSRCTRILPRSVYLAHQFAFYTLGEDYHGLLRTYNFDVPAIKVEVRRQIEVNASGTSMSESFVSGSSLPSQSGFSTSFDEAVSVDMRTLKPSPPVLPMYPNGPPSRSYRNSIPIRNVAAGISDGMTEGLGRLRREIGKVRSPRLAPKGDSLSTSVPLEFDEEDEDFMPQGLASSGDENEDALSRGTSREAASLSTPSTNIEPLPAEEDGDALWEGWGPEDKQAVEEVEQFDDIAVGFLDEDAGLAQPIRRR